MDAPCPRDSTTWLETECKIPHLAGIFSKYGLETTFAVGLLTTISEFSNACGIWANDAAAVFENIQGPRLLVQRWSPFVSKISTSTSVRQFLLCTPVPLLALRSDVLAAHGFDCLAALKNFTFEDGMTIGMSYGHALALHHIALLMNDPGSMPRTIDLPLEVWLGNISPPMGHYGKLIQLVRPDINSVEELLTLRQRDVEALLISVGHKRTLWSYVVKARTFWLDSL